jgi:predicted nucleotidyltransferase
MVQIISEMRNLHEYLQREYHISEIGFFGSVIRGEATRQSDLDILVSFTEPPDLFTFMRLEQYLTRKLGIKVDLVLKDSLKPYIGESILSEVVYL